MITESKEARLLKSVAVWASYYRANPHRFAEDRMGLHLKLFQKILLYLMNFENYFCYIASRGQGKTFIVAVFCCIRCVLFPGTKICIASGTRGQAINVLEKIQNELMTITNTTLRDEISGIVINSSRAVVTFHNGSTIKAVTASDSARGNRANILIIDEFRMVDKNTIDTVLRKFLTAPRSPGFLETPEYSTNEAKQKYFERNKEVYMSSAFFKSHWSYEKVKSFFKGMVDDTKKYFVCGLPYQLSICEGLLDKESVADEMSEAGFNEATWSMEMECLWFGDADGTFFDFDSIANTRRIQYPMLPSQVAAKLSDVKRVSIVPKQKGEARILSMDIALMSSHKNNNDATAIFVNQLMPTRSGKYINNIVYTESAEGEHTVDQALRVRKLFDEFQCDYLVLDAKGVGLGVLDLLLRDISDPESGEIYPALSCYNNPQIAERCTSPDAPRVIWAINASAKFNSDCAFMLREGFRSGKIRLLVSEYDGERLFEDIRGYNTLDVDEKLKLTLTYVETTLLINELIKLRHEESQGLIKMYERSNMRKDRYSSLSYNYYVANQLENKIRKNNANREGISDMFLYRAPAVKRSDIVNRW